MTLQSNWLLRGLTKAVSMVIAYLSCQGVGASCLGGASPSVLLDQEASPLEVPSGAACQGADPSYLQGEEPDNSQSAHRSKASTEVY